MCMKEVKGSPTKLGETMAQGLSTQCIMKGEHHTHNSEKAHSIIPCDDNEGSEQQEISVGLAAGVQYSNLPTTAHTYIESLNNTEKAKGYNRHCS